MWFLLLQIALLLVLAALLGAALAWWWVKRSYEDVTESHEKLLQEANRLALLATRDDLGVGLASLAASVAGIKPVDLWPVQDKLRQIEQSLNGLRAQEIAPMLERLKPIEAKLADLSLDPLTSHVQGLASAIAEQPAPDFAPIEQRMAELEKTIRSIRIPAPDLGPVHSGIATLQLALDRQGLKGLESINTRIGAIEGRVTLLASLERKIAELGECLDIARRTDHDAIMDRVAAVEQAIANFHIPAIDLRPLHASMIDLERAAMDKPPVDLAPVHNRLAALQASLAGLQADMHNRLALETLERRIASLQEAVQGMPEPDLTPVMGAVHAMESRIDLGALENRLTAIEYGLAALHHALRTRPEAVTTRTEASWQQRPDIATLRPRAPAPRRPPRELDPINPSRRAEDQANLLAEPAFGPPDDLEQIHGVGPMLRELLNDIGVYYFWQVAEWTLEEAAWVDGRLMHFRGRIRGDDWIERARALAAAPTSARRPAPAGEGGSA